MIFLDFQLKKRAKCLVMCGIKSYLEEDLKGDFTSFSKKNG